MPKEEDDVEAKPPVTEAEKLANRERGVLYLRHRLQKGFLSRDQVPQESEMDSMAVFFTQLEGYNDLEPSIIRNTKIHKVLKAIVKLASVPKDDEYNFKKRSSAMLEVWNKRMETDNEPAPLSAVEPTAADKMPETNGEELVEKEDEDEKVVEEKAVENADELDEKVEAVAPVDDAELADTVLDEPEVDASEVAPVAVVEEAAAVEVA